MPSKHIGKIKYVEFNHLILLSWHICDISIVDLVKLSNKLSPQRVQNIIPSSEYFILSTCNRVEIYIYSENPHNVLHLIKKYIISEFVDRVYFSDSGKYLQGMDAYHHLVKVTSGLNSVAKGEYQIQGQVKDAYNNALKDRSIGSYLISIIESALRTGKRVRSETEIGKESVSLSSLAIDIMVQEKQPAKESPILIVGTGKMCNLAAEYFIKRGYKSIIFFSNDPDKRKKLKLKYKALVLPISHLPKRSKKNSIIFSAVPQVTSRISLESLERKKNILSIIDLSIPKYILPSDSDLSYSYLLDMEGIQKIAKDYFPSMQVEVDKCEYIIHEEINRFVSDNRRRCELNISHSYI